MNVLKTYIEYLKDNPEGYWFKRKLYGWGWTPATREGWAVMLVFIVAVVLIAIRGESLTSESAVFKEVFAPIFFLVFILIYIAFRTGEKPCWMWGFPKKSDDEK